MIMGHTEDLFDYLRPNPLTRKNRLKFKKDEFIFFKYISLS